MFSKSNRYLKVCLQWLCLIVWETLQLTDKLIFYLAIDQILIKYLGQTKKHQYIVLCMICAIIETSMHRPLYDLCNHRFLAGKSFPILNVIYHLKCYNCNSELVVIRPKYYRLTQICNSAEMLSNSLAYK